MKSPVPIATRFLSRIVKHPRPGCWLWQGFKDVHGYGVIRRGGKGGKAVLTHRYSWELHRGEIPKGLHVLHSCDVPACVNPDHLFLGTQADNMRDMRSKGRGKAPRRFTQSQIEYVRSLLASGQEQAYIGRLFGVDPSTISHIARGKTYV